MNDPSLLIAGVAAIGALAAGATALTRPLVAFGILFVLASLSRATLETPLGTMRVEMPAIAVVTVVLAAAGRLKTLRTLPRPALASAAAFGIYLGVLAVSSALLAPGTAQSLHMVAWLAISMLGGLVALVLVRSRAVEAIEPLAFGGALMGAIGIVAAVLFLVVGPSSTFGIQESASPIPRVFGLAWESNLYASFLAMCAFFALEAARTRRWLGLAMLALVLIGFPLGITRGAWIGLVVGALAYAVVRHGAAPRSHEVRRLGVIAAALLVVGVVASNLLLPSALERQAGGIIPGPSQSHDPNASHDPVVPWEALDTVAFRLERVPIALDDLRRSPLIGFGAESFGQRHPDRYAGSGPDHIAILAIVVPYEAGIIGAAALLIGFVVLIASLWKTARRSMRDSDWPAVGAAAAFIGALVSTLVAYQATNALHLAVNWLVIGAAVALTTRQVHIEPDSASSDGS